MRVNTAAMNVHGTRFSIANTGYGSPWDGKLCELPEDEREHDHRQERLQHRPRDPDQRLLVANLDVAPGEDHREIARTPELAEVGDAAPPRGADGDDRDVGGGEHLLGGDGHAREIVRAPSLAGW